MMIFVKHPFVYSEVFFDKLMVLMNEKHYVCKVLTIVHYLRSLNLQIGNN